MSSENKRHRAQRDPRTFASGCRGKITFTSKRQALGVRRVMVKRGASDAATLGAYRCKACGRWHIGNSR
jgi:hypothetical protein